VEVIARTPSRLVVSHRESRRGIVWVVSCLAAMTVLPVFLPMDMPGADANGMAPPLVRAVFALTFVLMVAAAFLVARYSETYTLDTQRRTLTISGSGPIGGSNRTLALERIRDVYQEHFNDGDTQTHLVIVVLAPEDERVRLPARIFSFSAEERQRLGEMFSSVLGISARLVTKP
jgi:hypothetical protein